MNLFLQGMRRSGTTIVFDALSQDESLDLYYEPLSKGRPGALGGGSGIQKLDLMQKIRDVRKAYCSRNGLQLEDDDFNWGAPTRPRVEPEPDLPDHVRGYLRFIYGRRERTVAKFTRFYNKLHHAPDLAQDASVILLIRDPRAVALSYLYGKGRARHAEVGDGSDIFGRRTKLNAWNSRRIGEAAFSRSPYSDYRDLTDVEWLVLLWRFKFERALASTAEGGLSPLVLRHEDLVADSAKYFSLLYAHLGLVPPRSVLEFARANVHVSTPLPALALSGWRDVFRRLDMHETLTTAGYGDLIS